MLSDRSIQICVNTTIKIAQNVSDVPSTAVETGAPSADDSGMAIMKPATILARWVQGNQ